MERENITAVILNFNRYSDTANCLRSLQQSSFSLTQVVVVDNASTDGSEQRLRREFPDIVLLQTGKNLGYAGGMNVGIRFALQQTPEYIFIANSDTIVEQETIQRLVRALSRNSNAAAASGTIYYYPDKRRIWYAGGDINYWRASAFTRYTFSRNSIASEDYTEPVTFVSGCAFLVRSSVLQRVGLFDERFFMYVEDSELCMRFLSQRFQILYVPSATIYHKVEGDKVMPQQLYFASRNRLLFLRLAPNSVSKYFGFIYFFAAYFLKMTLWKFTKPQLFTAALYGISDFFAENFYMGRALIFVSIQ